MSRPPVIGVMSRITPFFHEGRPYPRAGVALGYLRAIERAGGVPVILPMTRDDAILDRAYRLIDGLLLPGGADMHPMHYGEEPHRALEQVDPKRDIAELAICRRALADDMPILAICRGQQVLNVVAGGTLWQDLHTQVGDHCHRHFQNMTEEWPTHSVAIEAGTLLHRIIGSREAFTNSYHHQAVKKLGEGLIVNSRATDGVIEGIEHPGKTFCLGVQWHPELLHEEEDFNLDLFFHHVAASKHAAHVKEEAARGAPA